MSKTPDQARKESGKAVGIWRYAVGIGFFAGLLFGFLKIAEVYFRFTSVPITFLIRPYFTQEFLRSGWGLWFGWGAFTLMSIACSLLYALLLRRTGGPWAGFAFGLAVWGAVYCFLGPWFGWLNPAAEYDFNTLITDACLFLIWGAFIGYSISFEFTSDKRSDPASSSRKNLTNV
ncbi:YqhR family membrane protein [Paenibacillus thermoaerophilus]|uniref:YqhR family membrane protein n=1 Tax=Paenibacillus thermoaerophilus TaxID=1215385 RepID=A0ABW2V6E2_9BACL|nr:YqhR family membrane protein [Paenibacillus thermoaerophilus]TMV18800.1 hypothetical protein FE781_02415 [Paenibacillus thermoaerophilus]